MYSTIVVGTDGSETAAGAVSAAAELARRAGATLHLVKAYQPTPAGLAVPVAGVVASDSGIGDALLAQQAEDVVMRAATGLADLKVEQHTAKGPPAEALVSVAEQVQADLIVVGSKGMHRRILGSVPNSVAHTAPCSVLIVKTT